MQMHGHRREVMALSALGSIIAYTFFIYLYSIWVIQRNSSGAIYGKNVSIILVILSDPALSASGEYDFRRNIVVSGGFGISEGHGATRRYRSNYPVYVRSANHCYGHLGSTKLKIE